MRYFALLALISVFIPGCNYGPAETASSNQGAQTPPGPSSSQPAPSLSNTVASPPSSSPNTSPPSPGQYNLVESFALKGFSQTGGVLYGGAEGSSEYMGSVGIPVTLSLLPCESYVGQGQISSDGSPVTVGYVSTPTPNVAPFSVSCGPRADRTVSFNVAVNGVLGHRYASGWTNLQVANIGQEGMHLQLIFVLLDRTTNDVTVFPCQSNADLDSLIGQYW